jgi:hypothetical protein
MADRRGFAEWEGNPVILNESGSEVGLLEEVTDWGIVLDRPKGIRLSRKYEQGSRFDVITTGHQVERQVSEFRPWHTISSIRLLEPEEREEHGF